MDNEYRKAEEANTYALAQEIQHAFPDARVKDLGWMIFVSFPNRSILTVAPLTADSCDVSGEDCTNKHWTLTGISWEQALATLAQVNALTPTNENDISSTAPPPAEEPAPSHATEPSKTWWTGKHPIGQQSGSLGEETSTGAVAPYSTPGAFARPGQTSNRGTEQSEREGWQRIGEDKERDQSGRKKFSLGYGDDPLGADRAETRPNKRSEGRRASPISHRYEKGSPLALSEAGMNESGSNEIQHSETLTHLASVLPCDNAQLENNKLTVSIADAEIVVTAQTNGNFSVQSFVAGEPVQASENVSAGDLIRWAFTICNEVQRRAAEWEVSRQILEPREQDLGNVEDWGDEENIEPSLVWEVMTELAKEAGHSTDILRNKSLFDLRQGLVTNPNTLSGRRFFGNDFNPGHTADSEVSASLKGGTTHGNAPVSINENRDVSRPYQNTMGGKKLVYLPGQGAVFVNAADMPTKKKLNWSKESGVILTDETEPTNRRGMWKPYWQQHH